MVGGFLFSSYRLNTDANILAFTAPPALASGLRNTAMGRPSRVFTSTLAKSKPSAMQVA